MSYQCGYCKETFQPKRTDSLYCSHSCRQMAYVLRKATTNSVLQGIQVTDQQEKEETKIGDFISYPSIKEQLPVLTDIPVRTGIENVNTNKVKKVKPITEPEYVDYESSYLTDIEDRCHERGNDMALDKFFDRKDAAAIWVSEIYRCLLECLLLFSEMKQVELDDLKEVCNAFTALIQARYFQCLHPDYPYLDEIPELRQQIRNICLKAGESQFVKYRPNMEQRKQLIVARFELSQFVRKKKFSELNFKRNN